MVYNALFIFIMYCLCTFTFYCCLDTRSYNILGIFLNGKNGLKYFPLFLMGKLVSVFEQIGARPPPQNGLWSSTEVRLYFKSSKMLIFIYFC